ncbi:MAG: ribonuclease J [Polyangiales bacterium]
MAAAGQSKADGRFRLVALGGLGEVGMNCLVLETEGRMLVIDCGVTFPDHEPGIDVIHPDFDYLLARPNAVEAVVLTHGHEDHIGALPYLLRELNVPVYGPRYALSLVEERLREVEVGRAPRLFETTPRAPLSFGPFEVTPFRVTHSIPDSTGLLVRVPGAAIVHSGDFKIDDDPLDGEMFDEPLLSELGDQGVRLLLSDSTNAEVEGSAGGERPVAAAIDARMAQATGRVVVSMFASNVHRLGAVLRSARAHGRRVLFLGRALHTHSRVADDLDMLPFDLELLVAERDAQSVPRERLLVLATGSQGEARAALLRLAQGTHQTLALDPGDEVILSSRVIPGRERQVSMLIDALERRGVRVFTRRDDPALHVSGHACRDEQRRMIELTRPQAFVPLHGTFTHLRRHAALAAALGVPETLAVENGAVVELDSARARVAESTRTGRVHIQQGGEITPEVLRDRTRMAESGLVVVTLWLDAGGHLLRPPEVLARGVVDELSLSDLSLREHAQTAIAQALLGLHPKAELEAVELCASRAARRAFRDAIGWRPVVHTVVHRAAR